MNSKHKTPFSKKIIQLLLNQLTFAVSISQTSVNVATKKCHNLHTADVNWLFISLVLVNYNKLCIDYLGLKLHENKDGIFTFQLVFSDNRHLVTLKIL